MTGRSEVKKVKFLGARLISYYNLVLSAFFIIGSIALIAFSKIKTESDGQLSLLPFFLLIFFGLFCIFSALKYLNHENIGRVCLVLCCLVQIVLSIKGVITTYWVTFSISLKDILMLVIGSWGIWYLNTSESKEWLKSRH